MLKNLFTAGALVLAAATVASAQSIEVYGSAGPTLIDAGNSVAAGIRVSPASRWAVVLSGERTHLSSETTRDPSGVISSFRGGTLLLGTAEVQWLPLGGDRASPYVLAGIAAGVSRPNVTEIFPDRITNKAAAIFVGGGLRVPVGQRVSVFGDIRWMGGSEGIEGVVAATPLRVGLALRF